jgi:hypothetical protein
MIYVMSGVVEQLWERFLAQAPRGFGERRAPPRAPAG